MVYNDLPPYALTLKLTTVSFSTPQKNLEVFKFFNSLKPLYDWIENERIKIFTDKEGAPEPDEETRKERVEKFKELLEFPISDRVYTLRLSESDFEDENCRFSNVPDAWLSANDIRLLMKFIDKVKEENGDMDG